MQASPTPLGTSIRIFLANGEAAGVRVVEKSNWTGKALMAPRTRYKELRSRPDLDGPGVYLLIGPTESGVPATRVYIGETDDLPGRLDSHNKNKDFWNRVIVFTSKDANLNKAHIRHLEGNHTGPNSILQEPNARLLADELNALIRKSLAKTLPDDQA